MLAAMGNGGGSYGTDDGNQVMMVMMELQMSSLMILDMDMKGFPYGDKGAGGRVWANRCQSTVLRANYDWDSPYSNGETVTVFYGDTVTLPGQNPVVIDENFTEDLIPGCVINGVNPKLKDMTNFDYTGFGKTYEFGIRHQFGFQVDYANASFDQGFTEQDIRFFLENKFFLESWKSNEGETS